MTARAPVSLEALRQTAAVKGLLRSTTLYSYAAIRTGGDPDALAGIAREVQELTGPDGLFLYLVKVAHTASIFAQGYADAVGVDLGELLDSFELDELNGRTPGGGQ